METLNILWTNADLVEFDKMVAMYARNAKLKHWWDHVVVLTQSSHTARP